MPKPTKQEIAREKQAISFLDQLLKDEYSPHLITAMLFAECQYLPSISMVSRIKDRKVSPSKSMVDSLLKLQKVMA